MEARQVIKVFCIGLFLFVCAVSAQAEDGTYNAQVKAKGGDWKKAFVIVHNDQVNKIVWMDGTETTVERGMIMSGTAEGRDDKGNVYEISVDDYLDSDTDENDPAQEW
jgi:hypothetical protein